MITIPRQRALLELRRTGGKPVIPPAWFADGRYRISPDDGQHEKRCNKCREYLPADDEFFQRSRRSADDRMGWCKFCCAEYNREYQRQHRRKRNPQSTSEARPCSP